MRQTAAGQLIRMPHHINDLESPMPLTDYVATARLTSVTDGDRTFAEWTAEVDCAPEVAEELMTGIGQSVFQAAVSALKRQMAGRGRWSAW